jgi:hypothetical protein
VGPCGGAGGTWSAGAPGGPGRRPPGSPCRPPLPPEPGQEYPPQPAHQPLTQCSAATSRHDVASGPPTQPASWPGAQVDPELDEALRRLRAAFGSVEVLDVTVHRDDQDQPATISARAEIVRAVGDPQPLVRVPLQDLELGCPAGCCWAPAGSPAARPDHRGPPAQADPPVSGNPPRRRPARRAHRRLTGCPAPRLAWLERQAEVAGLLAGDATRVPW